MTSNEGGTMTGTGYVKDPLQMTVGQRDGLLRAGIIRPFGTQWGLSSYVLAPGMTWDDVYAVTGKPENHTTTA